MRLRFKPSIANTIFALAGLLIALMAVVAALNTALSLRVGDLDRDDQSDLCSRLRHAGPRAYPFARAVPGASAGSTRGAVGTAAAVDELLRKEKTAADAVPEEIASARALLQTGTAAAPPAASCSAGSRCGWRP